MSASSDDPGVAAAVRVDVLMTAYNAEVTIASALASIQAQTLRAIRIVVVDDGSTDRTCAIVEELAGADPRVALVRKPHGGIVDSLRVGLGHCGAAYLARFDADDLSNPDRLERQLAQLEAAPGRVAVASAARHVDEHGRWLGTVTDFAPPGRADATWIPAKEPYMLQPFLMVRRAALDAAGGYRACEVAEDSDLYWRLRSEGEMVNTPDVLGDYRWHPGSISSRSIVRGRRIAFWSQLVALSARRRDDGSPDLVFDQRRLDALAAAATLDEHCRFDAAELTDRERVWLHAAVAAKLLEVAGYRPFELEPGDCRFARRALAAVRPFASEANRRELDGLVFDTIMRLGFDGRWIEAFLLDPRRFPRLVGRWSYRTFLPESLRTSIKRVAGRR